MLQKIKKSWDNFWKTEGQETIVKPKNETAKFELKYKDLLIGILELSDDFWVFSYAEEFKNQNIIRPIVNFPNVNKVYKNKELYPFFVQRIPSLKQPKVQAEIKRQNIDATNEVALLKHFGSVVITNPFRLYYA
jgi:HipA-like protein